MKVSKGQSQPEIVAAAILILYTVLASPFFYRGLIVTQMRLGLESWKVGARLSLKFFYLRKLGGMCLFVCLTRIMRPKISARGSDQNQDVRSEARARQNHAEGGSNGSWLGSFAEGLAEGRISMWGSS